MFKCGICGKEYESVEERMKCETECVKDLKIKEEELAKKKLEEEREAREKVIAEKYDEVKKLMHEYIKDYGVLKLTSDCCDIFDNLNLSNLNGGWWFL